ncbi:hypothetical protein BpHYR1_052424 [Brachionus plicatilis]|uniref:Uncharacterized protein n=1 Tax=Brachionus plicatilis TaxID=10195 RepID=A0A3M7QVP0_BRAPC|nr:hypothetical protein BpHYR1_052424 [Brachionus plicatilis]
MQDNLLPKSDSDYQLKNVRHHFDQYLSSNLNLVMIQISKLKIQSKELSRQQMGDTRKDK